MTKKCLFLKASISACASEEEAIRANLRGFGVDVEVVRWVSFDTSCPELMGKKFGIVYLGAHADGNGFGETGRFESWETLGLAICGSDCMEPEGTLFLGCCRGGMKTVALKILQQCNKIDYIFGPNWNTKGGDLVTAFTAYTRNRLSNGEEPAVAAKRASEAAGQKFTCYDRQELEAELELLRRISDVEYRQNDIYNVQTQILTEIQSLRSELNCAIASFQTTLPIHAGQFPP